MMGMKQTKVLCKDVRKYPKLHAVKMFLKCRHKRARDKIVELLKKNIIVRDRFNEFNCPVCTGVKANGI
jgi:hypothetical protein